MGKRNIEKIDELTISDNLVDWLDHNHIAISELTQQELNYLVKADQLHSESCEQLDNAYKEYIGIRYNIDIVCQDLKIHRTTAYKANKKFGEKRLLLDFVNDMKKKLDAQKVKNIKSYVRFENFDRSLMNTLLAKEKKYMESEQRISELEDEVIELKKQLAEAKNQKKIYKIIN